MNRQRKESAAISYVTITFRMAVLEKARKSSAGNTPRADEILMRLIAEAFCLPFSTAMMKVRFTPHISATSSWVSPFSVRISLTVRPRSSSGELVDDCGERGRELVMQWIVAQGMYRWLVRRREF